MEGHRVILAAHKLIILLIIKLLLVVLSVTNDITTCEAEKFCEFPAIFNFGDSNSDTGGLSAQFGQVSPPHGKTFFHAPAGRHCDGRLVIDFIAQSLGLPYLNAYLDAVGSNFSHGVNFAVVGSTIKPQNTSPISLNVQFIQYRDFYERSQIFRNKGGVFKNLLPSGEHFSKALYTFDMGQNDITAGLSLNMSISQVKTYILDVLDQFTSIIKDVYDQGGRFFWIHNTGPVGCLPYVLNKESPVDKIGCASPFNKVAQLFNQKLREGVAQLRKDLPYAAFTYVDVYSVKYDLISNATKYGFEHPLRACCGHGGKYNFDGLGGFCGARIVEKGKQVLVGKSCEKPSVAINWDGIHYTEAANKWVFERIANGSYSDPPIPLRMACQQQ